VVVVGFDGSPDVVNSILAGGIKSTILQPAAKISAMAVDEAKQYLSTGSTGKPEKQVIDCTLVTAANASKVHNFAISG
jgi:erythritol transport system substrate-binding protein